MTMAIQSPAFADRAPIPPRFTGDGEDLSPQLTWSGVPTGTKQLALIADDPDAPTPQPWVHWIIYRIPPSATGLSEGIPTTESVTDPAGALQGRNSWNRIGYGGPAPPRGHGVHHYHFKLYALNLELDVAAGLDKKALLAALESHILAQAELIGTYQR